MKKVKNPGVRKPHPERRPLFGCSLAGMTENWADNLELYYTADDNRICLQVFCGGLVHKVKVDLNKMMAGKPHLT